MEEKMYMLPAKNINILMQEVNKAGIRKEQIITIITQPEQYILLYYKNGK